ncbi:Phosphomethylpyrimidine kinase type-1 [Moelleriella libera RCEF 2490]|uniref:Phosphomethylpyrimidine kinase type-1 n=1 Tax=Moelleriella libera RCEF 2490 TaxID=1081109 RepID=A0A168A1U8_9HYPO|nr:Phosphomethylpyrimidine kinase type-1 [Moelleriella libera RCEF 2490]
MTSTTALTAQNTTGVKSIHVIPSSFVQQQVEACLDDIGADVVKTGMLASASTIEMVANQVVKYKVASLVVDPVMVSTSGSQLLPQEAVKELSRHLLPITTVLTPNIPEAKLILTENGASIDHQISSVSDIERMALQLQALGPKWVLVKGGHLPFRLDMTVAQSEEEKKLILDVLVGPNGQILRMESPYQASTTAISAGISKGSDVATAVRTACRYVEAAIRTAPKFGYGNGPLDHFHSLQSLPFSPGYFIEYLLQRSDVRPVWDKYVHHPFVYAMGDGSLPLDSFKDYIIQDYLFLFCRASALAAYKAKNLPDITTSNQMAANNILELKLHVDYCATFGISEQQVQATEEHRGKPIILTACQRRNTNAIAACTAYTRYCLDVGQSEDWFALQMALAPCLLGYGAVAKMLHAHPATKRDESNVYWPWIQNYVADDYLEAVRHGSAPSFVNASLIGIRVEELLEKHSRLQSPNRIEELVKIFIQATNMEIGFWDMFPYK